LKIKLTDGTIESAKTTGIARRMIQAGEAVEYVETKSVKDDDDKPKSVPKNVTAGPKKNGGSDVRGDQ
jgi:hypothetical protein